MEHLGEATTHAVVAVGRDATFQEVQDTLRHWKVRAVPVLTGGGRVVGVVSDSDLPAAEARGSGRTDGLTASALTSAPAVTVHPDSPTATAARAMARGHLRRPPVVDAEGFPTGVVSCGDLLEVHLRSDQDIALQLRFDLLAAHLR